jgi:hypothetical protein
MRKKLGKDEWRQRALERFQVFRTHEAVVPVNASSVAGVKVECHPQPIRSRHGDGRGPEPTAVAIDQPQSNRGTANELGIHHCHPVGFIAGLLDPSRQRIQLGACFAELLIAS